MVAVLPGKIGVPIFSILKAQAKPKHVVFLEGDNEKIQRACHSILEEAFGSRALSNPFSFRATVRRASVHSGSSPR